MKENPQIDNDTALTPSHSTAAATSGVKNKL